MNFIKNAIDGKQDEITHKQFRRFGKGVFNKKAMIQAKKTKDGFNIKTTFEYLDGILLYLAENFEGDVEVSGTIQGASDLEGKAKKFGLTGEKKNVMGVKKLKLNSAKLNASKLKDMLNEFKDEFLLLSISGKDFSMVSKEGLPKPGGKAEKDEEEGGKEVKDKIDFCKIECKNSEFASGLIKELLFDVNKDFKNVTVKHSFLIDGFDIPKEYANDPAKARQYALRVGTIKREVDIDGSLVNNEFKLQA